MSNNVPESSPEIETLLNHIKNHRGFDFTGYKHSSLIRRISKRMQMLKLESYDHYIDYLEVHPDEYSQLFNMILINVTHFFRDTETWNFIAEELVPIILVNNKENEVIRVWSAGCATGQEAYTIAMILAEKIGIERFSERVKIYATDLDDDALLTARQAVYTEKDVENIPPPMLDKYFERANGSYSFLTELRRSIIFGRHDLAQDAPISRVDLLLCRNTLMYFNSEMQSKILSRFHFAMKNTGFLVLGKAEMLFSHAVLFTPFDLKRRVFSKMARVTMRDRLMLMSQAINHSNNEEDPSYLARHLRFREVAFDANPVAQVVIDSNGFLVLANDRARSLLNLTIGDMNVVAHDLDIFYRIPELKPRIEEIYVERRPQTLRDIKWVTISGDVRYLEVQLTPLVDGGPKLLGVTVSVQDMTAYHALQEEIENANQELETAYEELQSTNEELETTNEELQSTIEELETTNEELQSTNEELETINEELQSTNEELQTMNQEANRRSDELNKLNHFFETVLSSLNGGVVVLNQNFQVQIWNRKAEDLWGLRLDEVIGKTFMNLDIGLPVDQLTPSIRSCLSRETENCEITVDAINRRGKRIKCRVNCTRLSIPVANLVAGVILLMEEVKT